LRKIWEQREPREKVLIGIMLTLFVLFFGWLLALKPIVEYPKAQKRAYEQASADLKIVKAGEAALQGQIIGVEKTVLSSQNFQSTITGSAGKHGLKISRRQPKGDNELSVWLENAVTPAFYAWAEELTSTYNMTVAQVHINRNDDGSVRVNITYRLES